VANADERVTRCIGSCERLLSWLGGQVDAWVTETLEHVLADLQEIAKEREGP